MWYWHFRARKNTETAALVLWFEGGPGGASSSDVFFSNGPFQLNNWPKGSKKAALKNLTWVNEVNMVYPDFPLGVGFSTVTEEHVSRVGKQVEEQILIFFENFLKKHPEYKKRPLYIAGVSYGGHWVPRVATALKYSENSDINVQGFYISSGLIDYRTIEESYLPFALKYSNYTHFTEKQVKELTPLKDLCVYSIDSGRNKLHTVQTFRLCTSNFFYGILRKILEKNKKFSSSYMTGTPQFDFSFINFLNDPSVQKYLGVRKNQFQKTNITFLIDYSPANLFVDMKPYIARLLDDGVKGVILVGDMDFLTNYEMSEKVTSDLQWRWQTQYNAAPRAPCKYGMCKEYKNLREVRVKDSGHGTSFFHPLYAFEIMISLTNWKPE